MARKPAGGVGSNQYQTRGGPASRNRSETLPSLASVDSLAAEDISEDGIWTTEDVAWRFNPEHKVWADAGFGTWASARLWRSRGYAVQEAAAWVAAGFDSDQAMRWQAFSPWSAKRWSEVFTSPAVASKWRQAGFQAKEAARWNRVFGSEITASAWRDAVGSLVVRCEAWQNAGFGVEVAGAWVKHGVAAPNKYRDDIERTLLANGEPPPGWNPKDPA